MLDKAENVLTQKQWNDFNLSMLHDAALGKFSRDTLQRDLFIQWILELEEPLRNELLKSQAANQHLECDLNRLQNQLIRLQQKNEALERELLITKSQMEGFEKAVKLLK